MNHYGPWLESLPSDAPDGSLWDVRHNDYEPDFEPSPEPVRCVVLGGSLMDREGRIARQSVTACRRVYPAGSVVPEPKRILASDSPADPFAGHDAWTVRADGRRWHVILKPGIRKESVQGRPVLIVESAIDQTKLTGTYIAEHTLDYFPVQFTADGAPCPVPWTGV